MNERPTRLRGTSRRVRSCDGNRRRRRHGNGLRGARGKRGARGRRGARGGWLLRSDCRRRGRRDRRSARRCGGRVRGHARSRRRARGGLGLVGFRIGPQLAYQRADAQEPADREDGSDDPHHALALRSRRPDARYFVRRIFGHDARRRDEGQRVASGSAGAVDRGRARPEGKRVILPVGRMVGRDHHRDRSLQRAVLLGTGQRTPFCFERGADVDMRRYGRLVGERLDRGLVIPRGPFSASPCHATKCSPSRRRGSRGTSRGPPA